MASLKFSFKLQGHYSDNNGKIKQATRNFTQFNEEIIVSSGYDNHLRYWNLFKKEENGIIGSHTSIIRNLKYSQKLKMLFSAGNDGSFKIWKPPNKKSIKKEWKLIKKFNLESVSWGISFNDNSNLVYIGTNCAIKIINCKFLKVICTIFENKNITNYSVNYDIISFNTKLIISSNYNSINIWNIITKSLIKKINAHENFIYQIHYIKKENQILSASQDGYIKLWNINNDLSKVELKKEKEFNSPVLCICYLNDINLYAIGLSDGSFGNGKILIVNLNFNKIFSIDEFRGNLTLYYDVKSKFLVCGFWDSKIKVYEVIKNEIKTKD